MDGDGVGSVIGDVLGEVGSEIKEIGKSVVGQVTGSQNKQAPTDDDIVSMGKKDKEFSEQGQEEVKARIAAIYAQHSQKRKRKEMAEEQQVKQAEAQKSELTREQKRQSMDVTVAQTKANAEIKNMGAE
ncbi:MAG: hypothetical protein Q7S45_01090 [Candidatus Curtissbacteria bacterium]|nr:hypothetical protein [Candidatus Curtissbacteria bacterium]